jgi:type I restriction enzyme M protein
VRPETPEKNDIPDLLNLWRTYKSSAYLQPPGAEGNSLLPPGSAAPTCWWVTRDVIRDTDYSLATGQYRPRIYEPTRGLDPKTQVRDLLTIENTIATELSNLLADLEVED